MCVSSSVVGGAEPEQKTAEDDCRSCRRNVWDFKKGPRPNNLEGRSHELSYSLFRLGHTASAGVKAFVETGRSDDLEAENQGEGGVFDIFSAPAISTGAGRTEAEFFVDGNHSRVSLMSRITPSPDWFIGLDSFNLCVNGNWLDSITIEVDPLDGGTDNGFTFTAPNWVTEPQGVVYRITSRYPSHPAGSFYYPYLKRLPPIATFQFIKAREYELNEVFHHTEDDKRYDLLKLDQQNTINVINNDHNNDIQLEMEAERKEQEMRLQQQLATRKVLQRTRQKYNRIKKNKSNAYQKRFRSPGGSNSSQPPTPLVSAPGVIPRGDTDAILNSIVETYHNKELLHKSKKTARKFRGLRDCRIGEWGVWSPCSMSCGVGEMTRKREVVKHARHGGKPCPPLVETKWCGSAQDCSHRPYFNW